MQRWINRGVIYSVVLAAVFLLLPWILQLFVFPDWGNPVNNVNTLLPLVLVFLLYWNRWWIIDTFIEQY